MEYDTILDYLTFCDKTKRLSSHTIRAYKNDLTHFYLDYNQDVTKYLDHLYCYYLKSSTLKRKIASLKAFYRYLFELLKIQKDEIDTDYLLQLVSCELDNLAEFLTLGRLLYNRFYFMV